MNVRDESGPATSEQCLDLLKAFVRIEDDDVREGVIALLEDLADQTGALFFVSGELVQSS